MASSTAQDALAVHERLIVCITGMPGAGKSTVAKAGGKIGFAIVNMGDAVREETARRNLELTDVNTGTVMVKLREQLGPGAIAQLALPTITTSHRLVVVDGVRSIEEAGVFKKVGVVKLLAVHASPAVRFRFLRARGREDAPLSWELFQARDQRELAVGIGEAIALADEVISNNEIGIDELQTQTVKVIGRWRSALEDRAL